MEVRGIWRRQRQQGPGRQRVLGAQLRGGARGYVLERYVPFIMSTAEELLRQDRALKILLNDGSMWQGMNHHHPASFDTLAIDPALKRAVREDLDRFLKRKEYYQRIGKAWKRGYLLYG